MEITMYFKHLEASHIMSFAELLKVEDMETHVWAILFENLRKISSFEKETGKSDTFLWFGHTLTKFFKVLHVFMAL